MISLPKPVIDVTSLELNEENQESTMDPARVISEHVSQGAIDMTLETGNALPIRTQPQQTSPWKHDEIER